VDHGGGPAGTYADLSNATLPGGRSIQVSAAVIILALLGACISAPNNQK
jgi:hypothetical protein